MNITRRIPWAGGVFIVCMAALFVASGCADRDSVMATDASGAQGAQSVASDAGAVAAEAPNAVQAKYDKREYQIVMRDGIALHTAIYSPRDTSKPYPILMRRTPYSCRPYGESAYPSTLGDNPDLMKDGYIYVFQDVRGCYMSEGEFVNMRPHLEKKDSPSAIDESTDTYDTIDWLIRNVPNNNGRVGMWGISYPGFYCAAGMIDAHPALKAVSPQASPADMWLGDDFHHNGAFRLSYAFEYAAMMESGKDVKQFAFDRYDTYDWYLDLGPLANVNAKFLHGTIPTWNDYVAHPDYDAFWKRQTMVPHLTGVK
ncbi:MAG: CocE/NonD family hydrolase, partial [Phycisphaerales bacterium]|nr:CocE/NonD family hydrolase [Phycisphaerales bacterium]